jgi:hypothetical protein
VGNVALVRTMVYTNKMSVEKLESVEPGGRLGHRWEENFKTVLKQLLRGRFQW